MARIMKGTHKRFQRQDLPELNRLGKRTTRRKRIATTAAAAVGMVWLTPQSASAVTTLTGLSATNELVPADHGSRLPGTPNIELEWSATGSAHWDQYDGWPFDLGDGVYQLDGNVGDSHLIRFVPDAGWSAFVALLDLNVWAGGGDTNVDWQIAGSSSGVLGSGTLMTTDNSAVMHIVPVQGVGSEALTLTLTQTSGLPSYLALDNLVFDQVPVPEPSSAATALVGLGGLGIAAMRRKRVRAGRDCRAK